MDAPGPEAEASGRKGAGLPRAAVYGTGPAERRTVLGVSFPAQYSWVEAPQTRAVSSLSPLEVWYVLVAWQSARCRIQGTVFEKEIRFVICPPLSDPRQHRLAWHLPYQFFIFSSLSLLNADVIYHVPIFNFNLKKNFSVYQTSR